MVSNERPGPVFPLSSSASADRAAAQTASFTIGQLRLELSAAPGIVTITISVGPDRDAYTVDPLALRSWSDSSRRLLALSPAAGPTECAEFRAPFLADVEGRASVAFEAAVIEGDVAYRLLVVGAAARVGVFATTRETLAGVVEAAAGAVLVARPGSTNAVSVNDFTSG